MKCIDDFINGNLTDAKKAASRKSWQSIADTLFETYGKSWGASCAIAHYLKGHCTFQTVCDLEEKLKREAINIK